MSTLQQTVRSYIIERTGHDSVSDDVDLFDSGLANSLLAVQIVMWVERTMGIPVSDGDLDIRNFRSIDAICEFVDRKRAN